MWIGDTMKMLLALFLLFGLLTGCGCHDIGIHGTTDSVSLDDPLSPDGPCTDCNDGDPCTVDLCDIASLECIHLPLDIDGDGYAPVICGGGDCNDHRSDVYPGAPEVCLDGLDQDCDTLVDGPVPMSEDVRVSHSEWESEIPRIVWTGGEFIVIWTDDNSRHDRNITMVRLEPDGNLVGEEIGPLSEHAYQPAPAWTGSSMGIVWPDTGSSGFTFLSLNNMGEEIVNVDITVDSERASLVWTGSLFGVGLLQRFGPTSRKPAFILLLESGSAASDSLNITTSAVSVDDAPAMIWTGSEIALVWSGIYAGSGQEIGYAQVSSSGEQITDSLQITDGGSSTMPDITWTGSDFGLAWLFEGADHDSVYFMKFNTYGTRTSDPIRLPHIFMEYTTGVRAIWTGSEFGVVWMEGLLEDNTLGFALVDAAGQRKYSSIQVTNTRNFMYKPDMAWTGSEFGVVWTDSRDGDPSCRETPDTYCQREIYFNRIGLCD
jgi:hypothetical protein